MEKIIGFLERLEDDQYIAVGAANGSGFYFMGKVKDYRTDIDGIARIFKTDSLRERKIVDTWKRDIPGEPEMISILVEGAEQGRLWCLSEADPSFKHEPKITDLNGLFRLREAISVSACHAYENLLYRYGREDEEIESFFKSDWGELITGADGQKIIDVCRIRAKYKSWRRNKKCSDCKKVSCIHNSGTHFVAFEKGNHKCLKEA